MLYHQRQQAKIDICLDIVMRIDPTVMLTFNFNPPRRRMPETMDALFSGWQMNPDRAFRLMTDFLNLVQREALSGRWNRLTHREWPVAHGFLENPETNFHYHCLAKLDELLTFTVKERGQAIWDSILPGGSLYVRDVYDVAGAATYCTKWLTTPGRLEAMFAYSDPRSRRENAGCYRGLNLG